MNLSKAISALIMQHGLYNVTLPFVNKDTGAPVPTDKVVHEVLSVMTIPIYSDYKPWIREGTCDLKSMELVDRQMNIYKLPAYLTATPVKSVIDVSLPFMNTRGTFGDIAPAFGINRSVQGVITSEAYMMLASQMRAEPSFKYLGFNKVQLFGYPCTVLNFTLSCERDSNGETIPESCYESFMELAALDLKTFLYNNLKYYNELPTAHGTINLKIDDYQSAEGDRKALLEKWDDVYHVDQDWAITFM